MRKFFSSIASIINSLGVSGFLGGVFGGILTLVVQGTILPNQNEKLNATIDLDNSERRQGQASLKFDFNIAPERKFIWSSTSVVGSFLHADSAPDGAAQIKWIDLSSFDKISFYAKSKKNNFKLSEFNIFVGQTKIQYVFNNQDVLIIPTEWKKIEISLDQFYLAPWVDESRRKTITQEWFGDRKKAFAHVTGVGIDIKTDGEPISDCLWIDDLRFVTPSKGESILFSDADARKFQYQGSNFEWLAGAQAY